MSTPEQYIPKTIEEYLNHDEMCISVVKKKYLEYPEQPVEEFYQHVIENICDNSIENQEPDKAAFVEACQNDWYKGVWKGAGSILAAAPLRDKKISVFNCTCLDIQEDSIEAIADTRKYAAQMAAHRQGLGVTFSKLRPRGAKINNSAIVSEGSVHWMKSFDNLANEVGQRGRLPAMLFALDINHPDVEEFITCKDNINNINNANISVLLNDEFMKCVKEDKDYTLSFTCNDGEVIEKVVKAKELFALICKQAWKNGEPGVIFKEKLKRYSIQEAFGYEIVGTNACTSADTPILTDKGYIPIRELVGKKVNIWNGQEWSEVEPKVTGYNQKMYRVTLEDGGMLECTGYHKFILSDDSIVECINLKPGDILKDWHDPDGNFIKNGTVLSVEDINRTDEKVYCFNEPKKHTGVFNGILTQQCSEKALTNQGVCCLAPLNMEFVPNPINDKDNFHKFMQGVIPRMVRFMDDVVQYEIDLAYKSPTAMQREMVGQLREIGLGILNLHKWFYNNNVAYGSDESIKMTEEFFKWYQYYAFKSSVGLAVKRGPCPAWANAHDLNKLEEWLTPFLENLFNEFPELKDLYYSVGIRNAALLSIAPTGTVSMTFPNMLSTGIEPLIGYAYWRRTRALSNNQGYDNFFVLPNTIKKMVLDKFQEQAPAYQEAYRKDYDFIKNAPASQLDQDGTFGKKVIDIINKYIDTNLIQPSHLIDPYQKVKLMQAAQKWIDASISVTYNVPFTFTEEDTQKLYMAAYEHGLKSITIYRDGSREGIYIFEDPITYAKKMAKLYGTQEPEEGKRPSSIQYHRAPKRPEELPCELHHTSIKGEQWLVLVGMLNGSPYEIFAGKKNEDFNISKNIQSGEIIKATKGIYTLRIHTATSWIDYHNIADLFMNVEYKALTRLISLSLRHGVYSEHILEQLKKSSDFVSDFMAVISRVLAKYTGNVPKDTGKICPQCGASIVRIEGCEKCSAECGYSRCE